ncbi:glycosyltransferase family 88 protein [Legionella cardiaca]|uniref:Glycosyltransferase family 88 protein n=1 Tax=Legionella cardiaca TaxID=1071983 RepID=A0ABY8AMW4_9GAMM|nr:glycosyltransferase family 88 protein [Legionella cardiaca]WED41985.1 glycosyltransferase family 88 protein [Legionella cardiaca]
MYRYNPHNHVKIWLSNNPRVFMNTENQVRLIQMREKNPSDAINLIYDSSLLNEQALQDLKKFCNEHRIIPVDANKFPELLISEEERKLYAFYKDEITHLKDKETSQPLGGNLAVASDILRWLSPVYKLGAYTDFDVPVDTTNLPETIVTESPLLLNIGSLRTGSKDIIISNNDYIAVIDSEAAKADIEKIQKGVISVLENYENDFIENTEAEFGRDSFLNKFFIGFMKNRSESIYIAKSKSVPGQEKKSSRELRAHIMDIMSDKTKFLEFNRNSPTETPADIIKRLRQELKGQLGFFKWLFFRSEYREIKSALKQDDNALIDYLMKKERTLYLKSIVVCTTGPIAIAKFLFNGYVFDSKHFDSQIKPYSFNHYGLRDSFQSKNSIKTHESIFGMIRFLGAEDGNLNDSSWLESGAQLQKTRGERLEERREALKAQMPDILQETRKDIEDHIEEIKTSLEGFRGLFFRARKREKIMALTNVLDCFKEDYSFDTNAFSEVLKTSRANSKVYAGFFSRQTKTIIENLAETCNDAIVLGLTESRQIKLETKSKAPATVTDLTTRSSTDEEPYSTPGLAFFKEAEQKPFNPPELGVAVTFQSS